MKPEPKTDEIVKDETANNTESTSMDVLVRDEIMPEKNQAAIDAVNGDQKATEQKAADPAAPFGYGVDGKPKKSNRGRKPGGEKAQIKSTVYNPQKPVQQNAAEIHAGQLMNVESEHAATVISGMLERIQIMLISDEFMYSPLEREANIKAWTATFNYYGGVNLSPPTALLLDQLGIIIARLPKPKTREKLSNFVLKIKAKSMANKFWKFGKKDDARTDSGTDPKRKNDIRDQKSG